MGKVIVQAHPNLALIKYWGKRDEELMLPTKSSLSLTLEALTTETTVTYAQKKDSIELGFAQTPAALQKIYAFLDLFRSTYGIHCHFSISSSNNFPTGTGLASSSSGFAALAYGLATLCNLNLSERELSILARRGSGSASRSIPGGIAIWHKGTTSDGTDCYAQQIFDKGHWPELRVLAVIVDDKEKKINSRNAMRATTTTNPLSYQSWITTSEHRLAEMAVAIKHKDLVSVGHLAEQDWHGMHASILDTQPSLTYWTQTSYTAIKTVEQIRARGTPCFFTTDAGANVFVCCNADNVSYIKQILASIPGVISIIESTIAGKPSLTII